jgi:hypothetical protein
MTEKHIDLCMIFGPPVFILLWIITAIKLYRKDKFYENHT